MSWGRIWRMMDRRGPKPKETKTWEWDWGEAGWVFPSGLFSLWLSGGREQAWPWNEGVNSPGGHPEAKGSQK